MNSDPLFTYLWNGVLTIGSLVLGTYLKSNNDSIKEQRDLLAKTREEIREKYVHKDEMSSVIEQINKRFDKLEEKLDTIIRTKH
jgi:Tfp pilus assembly protein PilO